MWEDRYRGSTEYLFGKEPAQFLRENPGWLVKGMTGLSVADGEGRNSVFAATRGVNMTAFDMSPTASARTGELANAQGVTIDTHVSDWGGWDWDANPYDLVIAIFIQFATPAERAVQFADLKKAVKPGGILMLHGYRPEQINLGTGGPPSAANMYTEELLSESFSDWSIERLASYERDVQEGRGHSGKSALIDLIARKPS